MKNKFTQIGQRHGNKNVAHKDTFFKTPVHFGGVQGIKMSKEDFLWERWKWE